MKLLKDTQIFSESNSIIWLGVTSFLSMKIMQVISTYFPRTLPYWTTTHPLHPGAVLMDSLWSVRLPICRIFSLYSAARPTSTFSGFMSLWEEYFMSLRKILLVPMRRILYVPSLWEEYFMSLWEEYFSSLWEEYFMSLRRILYVPLRRMTFRRPPLDEGCWIWPLKVDHYDTDTLNVIIWNLIFPYRDKWNFFFLLLLYVE